jgi:NADP-dependent 3-hydroxy acid dehydrogenase YdfG
MKVSITGHSRGLGNALASVFTQHGHTVTGFSRANGYNINTIEGRLDILTQASDSDIFINNAYDPDGQFEMLEEIAAIWKDTDKLIINISSKGSLLSSTEQSTYDQDEFNKYISSKQKQNALVRTRIFTASPRLLNVIVGPIDTAFSDDCLLPTTDPIEHKLTPSSVANFIFDIVGYQKTIMVQEIVIDVPGVNWIAL